MRTSNTAMSAPAIIASQNSAKTEQAIAMRAIHTNAAM
jgi:hypothetical protein